LPVRDATIADFDALTRMINTAYAVEHFIYDGERISPKEFADLLKTGRVLLLEQRGTPIACIYLELRDDIGYLGLLSVAPSRQNEGIGRSLVALAENWFRGQGLRTSELQVISVRQELLGFYRRLGYREAGTSPWPSDAPPTHLPCHFVRMTKTL
jgi:GNAT superfamily N-acetyltransferase